LEDTKTDVKGKVVGLKLGLNINSIGAIISFFVSAKDKMRIEEIKDLLAGLQEIAKPRSEEPPAPLPTKPIPTPKEEPIRKSRVRTHAIKLDRSGSGMIMQGYK
jgi:hypothetical protein